MAQLHGTAPAMQDEEPAFLEPWFAERKLLEAPTSLFPTLQGSSQVD